MLSMKFALFCLFSFTLAEMHSVGDNSQEAKDQSTTQECATDTDRSSLLMTKQGISEVSGRHAKQGLELGQPTPYDATTCPNNFKKTENGDKICCEPTCASYTCQTLGFIKKEGVASETNPTEGKCCEWNACPYGNGKPFASNHTGYKMICFEGKPFEYEDDYEGATPPTFDDSTPGYVKIPGGCCSSENQLDDLEDTPNYCGTHPPYGDCFTVGKNWCDSNPLCVSFETHPGWNDPQGRSPFTIAYSSSCQRNGYPAYKRFMKSRDACVADLHIKVPFAQVTANWLEPGKDSYKPVATYPDDGPEAAYRGTSYVVGAWGTDVCPEGSGIITTKGDCKASVEAFGFTRAKYRKYIYRQMEKNSATYPKGCFKLASGDNVYLNAHHSGASNDDARPICKKQ